MRFGIVGSAVCMILNGSLRDQFFLLKKKPFVYFSVSEVHTHAQCHVSDSQMH